MELLQQGQPWGSGAQLYLMLPASRFFVAMSWLSSLIEEKI